MAIMRPVTSSLRRVLRQPSGYVCWSCQQKRSISTTWLTKQKEAKDQWNVFGTEIRAKKRKSMLATLEERGFIHAIAGERNAVDKLMIDKRIGAYCGVDPTAASLHVGHMLPFMALFWMHIHGFHTISLIGGATAAIGDPTGRTTDRPLMTPTERKANITAIHFQLKRVWMNLEQLAKRHGYPYEKYWKRGIENNSVWWNNVTFLEVLKLLGRGLRLGPMLTRDTVKTKMDSGDGMSFAEFCYPILQGWDWWRMYNAQGIQMQIGGSDQFGNIVSGIEAVKYIAKNHPDPDIRQEGGVHELNTPYGFTVPLLTTASGAKFGKSAGNAIWLDQQMTSSFDLYGFFIRTADSDVERYLKLFTFLSLPEIQGLMAQHKNDPSKRIPHHKLAYEFVSLVHGEASAKDATVQHTSIFTKATTSSNPPPSASADNPLLHNQNPSTRALGSMLSPQLNPWAAQATSSTPGATATLTLPKLLIYDQPIARVLFAAGLVSSRSEGHRLAEGTGAYIGRRSSGSQEMSDDVSFVPAKPRDPMQTWSYVIKDPEQVGKPGEEGLLILRVGKWKVRIVRVVSDDVYEGMVAKDEVTPPNGYMEIKAQLAAERQRRLYEQVDVHGTGHSGSTSKKTAPRTSSREESDDFVDALEDEFRLDNVDTSKTKRARSLEGYKTSRKLGEQHIRREMKNAGETGISNVIKETRSLARGKQNSNLRPDGKEKGGSRSLDLGKRDASGYRSPRIRDASRNEIGSGGDGDGRSVRKWIPGRGT